MAMMCGGPSNWTYITGNGKGRTVMPGDPGYDGIANAYLHGANGIDVVQVGGPPILPILPRPDFGIVPLL